MNTGSFFENEKEDGFLWEYWFMVQVWFEENNMKNKEYKKLSIAEFTKAAGRYESNHAGIYEMCKKDYPDILEEN